MADDRQVGDNGAEIAPIEIEASFDLAWLDGPKMRTGSREGVIGSLAAHEWLSWPEGMTEVERAAAFKKAVRQSGHTDAADALYANIMRGRRDDSTTNAARDLLALVFDAYWGSEQGDVSSFEEVVDETPQAQLDASRVLGGLVKGAALEQARRQKPEILAHPATVVSPAESLRHAREARTDYDPERRQRRQQIIRANAAEAAARRRAAEPGSLNFLDHQPPIVEKLGKFLQGELSSGLLDVPPNAGKTFFAVLAVDDCGVGRAVPGDEEPIAALYVVPSRIGQEQVMGGSDGKKGFAAFAPHIRTSVYNGHTRDLSGDVKVITDRSLIEMAKRDPEKLANLLDSIDVAVLDEVHEMVGFLTAPLIIEAMRGIKTVAMTASSELAGGRTVVKELGIDTIIDKATCRDAVDDGYANGAQVFVIGTESEIKVTSKKGIGEDDLGPLRDKSPEARRRNEIILSAMNDLARSGRKGIVRCVPGDQSKHAQDIALLASQLDKYDDEGRPTGKKLNVQAVGNFQSMQENLKVLDRWNKGEIDALTFTDLLLFAFDSDLVEYVLDARPTTSKKDKIQLTGRGMRLKRLMTIYIELLDTYRGLKQDIVTFAHVFEIDEFSQGQRLTAKHKRPTHMAPRRGPRTNGSKHGSPKSPSPQPGALDVDQFSNTIQERMVLINSVVLRELTIGGISAGAPPPDWVRLTDTHIDLRDQGFSEVTVVTRIREVLEARGVQLVGGGHRPIYVPPDINQMLKEDVKLRIFGGAQFVSWTVLKKMMGNPSDDLILRMCDELSVDYATGRIAGLKERPGRVFRRESAEAMVDYFWRRYPPVTEELDATTAEISEAVAKLNGKKPMHTSQVRNLLLRLEDLPEEYRYIRYDERGMDRLCIPRPLLGSVARVLATKSGRLGAEAMVIGDIDQAREEHAASLSNASVDPFLTTLERLPGIVREDAISIERYLTYFMAGPTAPLPDLSDLTRQRVTRLLGSKSQELPSDDIDFVQRLLGGDPKVEIFKMMTEKKLEPPVLRTGETVFGALANIVRVKVQSILEKLIA